jgi:predicted nuclease of restriction endonuclease-like (RecB) superfamily
MKRLTFAQLVLSICSVHAKLTAQAAAAVNISLTIRNWVIGYYIEEYERAGIDRARYGDKLMDTLAAALIKHGLARCDRRELYRYRRFYLTYPQIVEAVTPQLSVGRKTAFRIARRKVETLSPQFTIPGSDLIERLSFSHLAELIEIDDQLKRAFYEHECVRGNWSVRELKRQIATLYYERSGLSGNKKKLAALVSKKAEADKPEFTVRDPYVFEFLGLKSRDVMGESHLEDALLDRLQDFLLELGHGFCFEARQKRIVIGGEYCFVDLVFYHRILKCHVLIELKVDAFKHEYIGQLNTYVGWYRRNAMTAGDNPPVGILLCTRKNHAMVEYALAGMDNKLFVRKYQLELPKKEEMRKFLEAQMKAG